MRIAKTVFFSLASVILLTLCLLLARLWLSSRIYSTLLTLVSITVLLVIMFWIWVFMINVRINEEKINGNLGKWLADIGLRHLSASRPVDLLKQIIEIRIDPRRGERDRNYAAFLIRTGNPKKTFNHIKHKEAFDYAKI